VTGQSYVIPQAHTKVRLPPVEFNEITADNAGLEILPQQNGRKPHSFWIHHLTLCSVKPGQQAYFHAELTNEIPAEKLSPMEHSERRSTQLDAGGRELRFCKCKSGGASWDFRDTLISWTLQRRFRAA